MVLYRRKEFRFSSGEHSLNINMAKHSVAENGALNSATLSIDPKHRLGLLKLFAETAKTSRNSERDKIQKGQDRQTDRVVCCSFAT
jgi:protein subunit release factor B